MKREAARNNSEEPLFYSAMSEEGMSHSYQYNLEYTLAKDKRFATPYDNFMALSYAVRDRLVERWIKTQRRYHHENQKRVYYLSMEFLIGRLLGSNILNLGLWDETYNAMEDMGHDVDTMRNQEIDAGLGNGGLGRLAACFLDSMATLGIPAHGYGIRYDFGIFNQKIVNGQQMEEPDEWLKRGNPWEIVRPEYAVKVKFYGKTYMQRDADGRLKVQWVDTEDVLAMPYDIPIPGYKNDVVNTLRLWSARSTEEFDFEYFNHGDYEEAVHKKILDENISRVLYPNDNVMRGRILRLKQEYFFTAASVSDIIRRFKEDNSDWSLFPEKVAIQLNDTHPALSVVELMRILVDQEGLEWDRAWDITIHTFAYTNHTLMPEALERWSVDIFRELLPRHLEIVYEINQRFLREVANAFPGDTDRLRRMSLIEEGEKQYIRMAYLSIVGSHSVNGVSELHSRLITELLFKDFYELYPEKFNNKTNGITQRRWLRKANTRLSCLITDTIGDEWITNLYELRQLLPYKDKPAFRQKWQEVKAANKNDFAGYIRQTMGIDVNPESIFDVQVKRIHEYKRQILLAFYVLDQYLKVKYDPRAFKYPRTFVFGGKAAPGYYMAKLIIRFINSIAAVINGDRQVGDRMKVVFLENYRVSLAERVFPASDLSEQISTAGYEASGTGCMKFMVNGALTIGTRDGATVEMAQEVGPENIFLFGLEADDVQVLKRDGYRPQDYISHSPVLQEIFKLIRSNFFSPLDPGLYEPLAQNLMHHDPYLICADFDDYCSQQDIVSAAYRDQTEWTKRSIVNVASSGKFSGDRTIAEYARDIWNVPVHHSQAAGGGAVHKVKTTRNRKCRG